MPIYFNFLSHRLGFSCAPWPAGKVEWHQRDLQGVRHPKPRHPARAGPSRWASRAFSVRLSMPELASGSLARLDFQTRPSLQGPLLPPNSSIQMLHSSPSHLQRMTSLQKGGWCRNGSMLVKCSEVWGLPIMLPCPLPSACSTSVQHAGQQQLVEQTPGSTQGTRLLLHCAVLSPSHICMAVTLYGHAWQSNTTPATSTPPLSFILVHCCL